MKLVLRDEYERRENIDIFMLFVAILGSSRLSIRQIIKAVAKTDSLPNQFTKVFVKAHALAEKWSYGVSEVLEFLQAALPKPKLRNLIIRVHHASKAGVALEEFARIEYEKHRAEQANELEKALEKLRRLVEAYTTLVSVLSLLTVSFLLVTIITGGADYSFLEIAYVSIAATLGSTSLLFFTNILRRPVFNNHPIKPKTLQILITSTPIVAAACLSVLVAAIPLAELLGGTSVTYVSTVFIAVGGPVAAHGYFGRRWQKKINKTESMLPIFLKGFGDYLSATGSVKAAAHMLTLSDFGPLNKLVKRLETRLSVGIYQAVSLKTFGLETMGKLGEKVFSVLAESLQAGAKPNQATGILSEYVSTVLMTDKRREQITSSLKTLAIPLHATLAAIYALLTTLLSILSEISKLLENYLMIIKPIAVDTVAAYFYIIMVTSCIITSINIYLSDGDSGFSFTYYLGILLVVSGLSYLAMANASSQLLSSFTGLSQSIQSLTPG